VEAVFRIVRLFRQWSFPFDVGFDWDFSFFYQQPFLSVGYFEIEQKIKASKLQNKGWAGQILSRLVVNQSYSQMFIGENPSLVFPLLPV
jgi:hypothetical protein